MDIRLSVTQNQILSQKMIQSMEILQMSSQELNEYIKEVALENPVVDIEEAYETPDKAADLVKSWNGWIRLTSETVFITVRNIAARMRMTSG